MRKHLRLFAATLGALLLTLLLATPAFAAVDYPKKLTTYLSGIGESDWANIEFSGYAKDKGIVKSSIKSSKTSVVECVGLTKNSRSTKRLHKDIYIFEGSSNNDTITLRLKKPGTAKVKYKAGTKTYTTTVVVKKYVNPVKTFTITGINSGKNLASKFKTNSYVDGKASKKTGKITVAAASGWKVRDITYDYGDNKSLSRHAGNGVSKLTLTIPEKMKDGYIQVEMYNSKTDASIFLGYQLNH